MSQHDVIVIIGAGQAGAVAASALRTAGHAGPIILLGREPHRPYERPPLSKAVLGEAAEPRIDVLADDAWTQQDLVLHRDTTVTRLDMGGRRVELADGRRLAFDQCLLATGGEARRLPGLPAGHPRVHTVRSLDDARRLRGALGPAASFGVIGAGFLGLELATAIRGRGARVDVIETAPSLLSRFLPPAAAHWLAARHRAAGIGLHLGARMTALRFPEWMDGSGAGGSVADGPVVIELTDAEGRARTLEVDHLVVAVGLAPNVELARAAGAEIDPVDGGVRVDAAGRTSLPGLFAAGDCASQRRADGHWRRIESWQNANEQAKAAAAGLLGLAPPAPPLPWFWTDQAGCNLQMLGEPAPALAYVLRGDPSATTPKAIWLGLDTGRPVHALAVNAGTDLRVLRPLFERGLPIDATAFADPATALRPWVRALTTA